MSLASAKATCPRGCVVRHETALSRMREVPALQVAPGEPELRGAEVSDERGEHVGVVWDIVVDVDRLVARYAEVAVADDRHGAPPCRHVLIPLGLLRPAESGRSV